MSVHGSLQGGRSSPSPARKLPLRRRLAQHDPRWKRHWEMPEPRKDGTVTLATPFGRWKPRVA